MNDLAYQAEATVLGSLIVFPNYMNELILSPDDFTADSKHSLILEFMQFAYEADGTIDLTRIAKHAGKHLHKIGGISYLGQLASSVPSEPLFEYNQEIVKRNSIEFKSKALLQKHLTEVSDSIEDSLNEIQDGIEQLQDSLIRNKGVGLVPIDSTLDEHVNELVERKSQRGLTGVPQFSQKFIKMSGGYQRQELIIVGGRPSMGKTQFILNEARAAYKGGFTPALFSIETKAKKMAERLICQIGRIDNSKLRTGQLEPDDWNRYNLARNELSTFDILIDDTPSVTLQYIRREVRKLVKSKPNSIVFIDYLQLIDSGKQFKDKRLEIEFISRSLKELARECDIPIVVLSQLSRSVEQRQDKRPMLSDLKEAGGIEADADVVIFLYRDEYYNKDSKEKGTMELIIAKGRDIGTGTIKVAYESQYGNLTDITFQKDGAA